MDKQKLAIKYSSDMCDSYEEQRIYTPQWLNEQSIVENFLKQFPAKTTVLDIPVGKGRFLEFYARSGFVVTGIDISDSMLKSAKEKNDSPEICLQIGDVFCLKYPDNTFDVSVCIRFMNWINEKDFELAFSELARVTKKAIIIYIPTYSQIKEIHPFHSVIGFLRMLRQWKLRFYRFRVRTDEVIHKQKKVNDIFNRFEFDIKVKACIDKDSRNWMRGYERSIYLAVK